MVINSNISSCYNQRKYMGKAGKFELTFLKKEKQSYDAYSIYFDRKNLNFNFKAGQYLKLFLDIEKADARGSSRYFTISSSPTDKDYLTITTRIIKSSFKLTLNFLKPGDKLKAFGPIGYFDFDPEINKDVVFIAGGIGVTPYHSLIRYIDFNDFSTKVTLLASFDLKKNAVFYNEFKEVERKNSAIKIIYSLTKENKSIPGFESGRIDENMIKKYVHNISFQKYFITGPQAMVENLYSMIKNLNISDEKIFKEDFPGY